MVGLIPPTNANSNVESAVVTNLQSALDKDVSIMSAVLFRNTTVSGNLANKKARRDHMIDLDIRLCPHLFLVFNQSQCKFFYFHFFHILLTWRITNILQRDQLYSII